MRLPFEKGLDPRIVVELVEADNRPGYDIKVGVRGAKSFGWTETLYFECHGTLNEALREYEKWTGRKYRVRTDITEVEA